MKGTQDPFLAIRRCNTRAVPTLRTFLYRPHLISASMNGSLVSIRPCNPRTQESQNPGKPLCDIPAGTPDTRPLGGVFFSYGAGDIVGRRDREICESP